MRIPFDELMNEFRRVLERAGVPGERAGVVARLLAENQRDGVYSHGLNRVPTLLENIRAGRVDVAASPERVGGLGALEQWDGHRGLGQWNARIAMDRAVALAREHGLGCVGLRNTNHWMRAGAYGLQAADAGCVGICWTNTIPIMPPWGSAEVRIGNNPLVIAVPRSDGHLLLDMAMSQYSMGKTEVFARQGKALPFPGGFNPAGELTRDPAAILASGRPLPIGYWKGSALSVILDAVASLVAGGRSTHQIGREEFETGVSQIFLALDVSRVAAPDQRDAALDAIIEDLRGAAPLDGAGAVRYPGEGMLRLRAENLSQGVWVDEGQYEALRIWS